MGRPVPKTTLPYPTAPYWCQGFQFYAGAKMVDITERNMLARRSALARVRHFIRSIMRPIHD